MKSSSELIWVQPTRFGSVFQEGRPLLIPNSEGEYLTPSVVGILEGRVIVGAAARELQVTRPDDTIACFKRWMGTAKKINLGDRTFSPTELSSLVLTSLKNDAEAFLNQTIESAVITVPAYFNENQRKATKNAGELGGPQCPADHQRANCGCFDLRVP